MSETIVVEFSRVPQSTPKKASHQCSPPYSLIMVLTSPQQTTISPQTRSSLSGIYLARPPIWEQSVVGVAM